MNICRSPYDLRPGGRRSRRAVAAVALAATVLTSAGGSAAAHGDAPPANDPGALSVACPGLPRGLALTGNGRRRVLRVTRSGSTFVARLTNGVITKAVRGRDGTIWVEVRRAGRPSGVWRRIVRLGPAGSHRMSESGNVRLSHVGVVGRRGRATVATYIDRDGRGEEKHGHVWVEFSNGTRRSVERAAAIEEIVVSAAPARHRDRAGGFEAAVALNRHEDMDENFLYRRLDGGAARGHFDPNDDAQPGRSPIFEAPILSPKGAKLSWPEGPDFSFEADRFVGTWRLVVADSHTGAESLRVRVGRRSEELRHADYDGRYWVGTFSKRDFSNRVPRPSELRVRVVDTWAATPHVVEAGCTTGFIASIDRFVKD